MKFSLSFIFIACAMLSRPVFAQEVFSPYYVVIGGFKSEANARNFCIYAQEQNLPAVYAFNEARKTFYVYIRATQSREVALDILKSLRESTVFKDAWVFNGVLSGSDLIPQNRAPAVQKTPDPQTEKVIAGPVVREPEDTPSAAVPQPQPQTQVETPKPVGRAFVFKLLNGENGNAVDGLVRLQESERALQFRGFNGNEKVYVPAPANKSGKWYVVSQVLGFRPLKKPLNYERARETHGASVGPDEEIIIPLALHRVRKGDYIEMENVKFFNNTALFSPGSELELDGLVAMMQENPGYQIKLHGHTNGNEERDIVSIGNSANFFGSDIANTKTHGTAKELALLRAELVKAYLVQKGIDSKRISTKGEGGTQMIFDPSGTLAGLNDRVEVEIKKH